MAQTVFKWYKNAIRKVIYCNCSQIFEQKRDCSGEQKNGTRGKWLHLMKQDGRFQKRHQKKYRCG